MIGFRGYVVVIEVRFGNAIDARGCGNQARIAEVSGGPCMSQAFQVLVSQVSIMMQANLDIGVIS